MLKRSKGLLPAIILLFRQIAPGTGLQWRKHNHNPTSERFLTDVAQEKDDVKNPYKNL